MTDRDKEVMTDLQDLKLYTLEEAKFIVGLTPQTLKRHIKAGMLSAKKIGGKWRVTRADLEKYISGAN